MLEKILNEQFKGLLKLVFTDIANQQDCRDEEEFAKDEVRIKEDLIDTVDPYPAKITLPKDFRVAAVDGSGTDSLVVLDDIRVHLFSVASVVLETGTRTGHLFKPVDRELVESELGEQPHLDAHWHSGIRGDARNKLAETLANIYPVKDLDGLVLPFFRDHERSSLKSISELTKTSYQKHVPKLEKMKTLISRVQMLTNAIAHEELRKVSEYAAARKILTSDLSPKYLLLDGAMTIFMHFVRQYPSMPSGFMLREMCSLAREKGIILCAVSKNHTIPFAHRIAKMAQDKYGLGAKWFCHLPCKDDSGGGLHITENRTYIPPRLAVPYLFSFTQDNRPSRIDFDRIWWLENILVHDDPIATRKNELVLFKELEFMSRDARWYGYPVALALAHESCKLSYEDLRLAREVCREVRFEMGFGSDKTEPLRVDYNL
ncbi:MAG: hypothetical protein PVG65_03045 [Candidatus Thorarchaeota archaeon]